MNADPTDGPGRPDPRPVPVEVVVSGDIKTTLDSLIDRGWAVDWELGDTVTCHLILFSSRRIQGVGADANAAARAAIRELDAI
ncbi:MAG: hypothetical protein OER93_00760 [Thermoleophilia bacterium]|nr:hypothetical protein [Thermoleophilia bacterium]